MGRHVVVLTGDRAGNRGSLKELLGLSDVGRNFAKAKSRLAFL